MIYYRRSRSPHNSSRSAFKGSSFQASWKGGDDNLVVYVANCAPSALRIQNREEFIEEVKKIAAEAQVSDARSFQLPTS